MHAFLAVFSFYYPKESQETLKKNIRLAIQELEDNGFLLSSALEEKETEYLLPKGVSQGFEFENQFFKIGFEES